MKLLPMLAKPLDSRIVFSASTHYTAEEKFDGHRMITRVTSEGVVEAWSRTGVDSRRKISKPLHDALIHLPPNLYDGELVVEGGGSSDVARIENLPRLYYVVFDLLEMNGTSITHLPQAERRAHLESIFDSLPLTVQARVRLAEQWVITSPDLLWRVVDDVWNRKGEGVIVKNRKSPYFPGKRSDAYMKVKECNSSALRIIGFAESEGEIMNYGAYGTAVLQNEEGVIVPVKVLDDKERARLNKTTSIPASDWHWAEERLLSGKRLVFHTSHPYVGRLLRIEYQTRTQDGSYRHPRWDRYEDE